MEKVRTATILAAMVLEVIGAYIVGTGAWESGLTLMAVTALAAAGVFWVTRLKGNYGYLEHDATDPETGLHPGDDQL